MMNLLPSDLQGAWMRRGREFHSQKGYYYYNYYSYSSYYYCYYYYYAEGAQMSHHCSHTSLPLLCHLLLELSLKAVSAFSIIVFKLLLWTQFNFIFAASCYPACKLMKFVCVIYLTPPCLQNVYFRKSGIFITLFDRSWCSLKMLLQTYLHWPH